MSTEIAGCAGRLECPHVGVDVLELGVAVGVAGAFARLAVGLQAEAEASIQQGPADQLLTGDEASLGQRRGEMALAQADPPQRSLRVTADRRLHHPCGEPARCIASPRTGGPLTAAYGASGNSGGPRNRNNSAAAGSACFTGREQASVSFVEERSECIVAGPDGILVDHPVRLDAKTPDSHRLFGSFIQTAFALSASGIGQQSIFRAAGITCVR